MKEFDVLSSRAERRRALLGAGLAVAAAPLRAQDAWPARPVRVVIPFPPGGGGDTLARLVMPRVGKEIGANFVMENIAGAGGNIGSRQVAQSPADGYTLLYGTNGTHGINQTLYEKPGFDAQKDFAPISQLTRIAAMVVVRPGLAANTMPELLKLLKSNPGKLTFASAGNGTTSHLAGELLKASAGVFMVHIPYRGGGPAMTDVIGGQVDLMIDVMPNAAPHVRSGRLRGLAVSTARRVPTFPNVPTIAESGVPGFDVSAWDAVFAPAGTPPAIVRRLNQAIVKVLGDAELRASLLERGAEVTPSTPDELAKFIAAEIPRWGAAIKRSNAKVE